MMKNRLLYSAILAFIVAMLVWIALFVGSGLPGQFSENGMFFGKGPSTGYESFACIMKGGALKLYRTPCDIFEYVGDRIVWLIPYFFASLLFQERSAILVVVIFLISLLCSWFVLGYLDKGRKLKKSVL